MPKTSNLKNWQTVGYPRKVDGPYFLLWKGAVASFILLDMSANVSQPPNIADAQLLDDDQSLAIAMRMRDDHTAFDQLRIRHCKSILAYTSSRVFKGSEAEDVAQEVWIKVWACRDQFSERGENSFRRWLFTIASRSCIDANRRKRPEAIADDFVVELGDNRHQPPDWSVVLTERQSALEACIAELPDLQKCIVRATLAGEKTGLAAENCGCSAPQASTAKHHAIQSLRDCTKRKGV